LSKGFASSSKSSTEVSRTGGVINSAAASTTTATQLRDLPDSKKATLEGKNLRTSRRENRVQLDTPFPGLQQPIYNVNNEYRPTLSYRTQLTHLDSGYRVASQERHGKFATIGVAISTGARFETGFPSGVSHIAEKLAFGPSRNYPHRSKIMQALEEYGGICDCQTSRDTTVFAISTEVRGVERMMHLLADVLFYPSISEDDLSSARTAAIYEMEDMQMKPEQEAVLLEMIHAAAWGNQTLGLPRYCPPENAERVTREDLLRFMKTYVKPNRMVISGVGVDHQELIDMTNMYFNHSQATWNVENIPAKSDTAEAIKAIYTPSMIKEEKDFGQFNAGPLPVPNLAHISLGLESISHKDPDFITACVLNIVMGGGGSFSAGGPGKGMYSRLYMNVLNQYHWIYNATAYNNSYGDSGLFCIYAASPPTHLKNLVHILITELAGMAAPIPEEELKRAKVQLKSMLLMNLEARPVVFEDIGRQILANGFYRTPTDYIALIEKVQAEDIYRLAKRIQSGKPCIAALGNLQKLPSLESITSELSEQCRKYN
jgi:processing peptidase subunit alpha